jgi:hypothetical protein
MFPASIRVWSVIRQQINTTTSQTIFVIYCRSSIQNYENKKKQPKACRDSLDSFFSTICQWGHPAYVYSMCVCTEHSPARVIRRAELRDSTWELRQKIPGARMQLKEMETENKI